MPWTTLGLDAATATERDVKRAYATRLKTCRPDQDPEGFRKLHDAYQAALYELQWRSVEERYAKSETADSPASAEMPQVTVTDAGARYETVTSPDALPTVESSANDAVAIELSPGLRAITDAFDRLESAFADGADTIPALIEQTETLLYEHPSEVVRWGELASETFSRHGDHPDLRLKADTIVFELEQGGVAATLAIIDRLDRKGSPQAIANLTNLLIENKARIATPAGGLAAARLAGAAAFWAKRHTEGLADFAYQHLARGERDFHMQLIDRHVGMAQLMIVVPDHLKSFWRQRMMRTAGRDTWDTDESKAAIEWLKTPLARRGPCFEVFVGLLPEDLAESVKAKPEKWQAQLDSWTSSNATRSTVLDVDRSGSRTTGSSSALPRKRPAGRKFLDVPEWDQEVPGAKSRKREHYSSSAPGAGVPPWAWGLIVLFIIKILVAIVRSVGG